MSQTTVYNWLKNKKTLIGHLPLNDDVSGMTSGGSLNLTDTEGYFTLPLTNQNSGPLPINIPGPIPGSTAIQVENESKYAVADYNVAVQTSITTVPSNSSWSAGVWFAPSDDFKSSFGKTSCLFNLGGGDIGTGKAVYWYGYQYDDNGEKGPFAELRDKLGLGTKNVVGSASISTPVLGWSWVVLVFEYQGRPNYASLYVNGKRISQGEVNRADWEGNALRLFSNDFNGYVGECGFQGALWDFWVTHDALNPYEVNWLYKEYLGANSTPLGHDMTSPMVNYNKTV